MSNPTRLHVPALAVTLRTTPEPEAKKQEVLKYLRSQGLTKTPELADKITNLALDRAGVAKTAPLRTELRELIAKAGSGLLEAIQRAPAEYVPAGEPLELSGNELEFFVELPKDFQSTADIAAPEPFVGQERLREALQLGLSMNGPDYNVLISGLSGKAAVNRLAAEVLEVAKTKPVPDDQVFVPSFTEVLEPRAIRVPAGKGSELSAQIQELARFIEKELPGQLEKFASATSITKELTAKGEKAFAAFQKAGKELGLAISQRGDNVAIAPVDENGEPISMDELNEAQKAEFTAKLEKLKAEAMPAFTAALVALNALKEQAVAAGKELLNPLAQKILEPKLAAIAEAMGGNKEVKQYLDAVLADVVEQLPAVSEPGKRYAVKVTVDNSELAHAPVVVVNDATAEGLFGSMYVNPMSKSVGVSDIEVGDLAKANGGYLVVDLSRLAREPETLVKLIDSLAAGEVNMGRSAKAPRSPMRPQPFGVNVKVIAIGGYGVAQAVKSKEIGDVFKANTNFDPTLPNDRDTYMAYAGRIGEICRAQGIPHFDKSAVAAVLERSARNAGSTNVLEALSADLEDLVQEAHVASRGAATITGAHVKAALEARTRRANLGAEAMLANIIEGGKLIDVTGAKVGQINGLAVLQGAGYSFGLPSRITATVGVGQAGVINIERKADETKSGYSHNKGVEILQGYLRERFGSDKPIAMTASVTFEQMYGGVDGDSASSTELYAMLSKLSGVPIRQGIAVTGSVNQRGEVQPIGGVNHKVEGFFDVCKARGGLTGTQGVMVPLTNMKDLVLRPDVVEAIKKGEFHIYPIKTIDQGIEVLTGVAAGDTETAGTINYLVDQRLRTLKSLAAESK